jgi:hypothetical protein
MDEDSDGTTAVDAEEIDEDGDDEDDESELIAAPHYTIAKHIPKDLTHVKLETLQTDYGVPSDVFLYQLDVFLRSNGVPCDDFQATASTTTYPCYRRFYINIPPSIECTQRGEYTRDSVRATPAKIAKKRSKCTPAHFDTVLARKTPLGPNDDPSKFDASRRFISCFFTFPSNSSRRILSCTCPFDISATTTVR